MPEQRINAGQAHTFPAGTVENSMTVENRHNVNGTVQYQIGTRPQATAPLAANEPDFKINNINGLQVRVTNQMPNSVYCVW